MKMILKVSALMMVLGAIFVGCGGSNNNNQCQNGQVMATNGQCGTVGANGCGSMVSTAAGCSALASNANVNGNYNCPAGTTLVSGTNGYGYNNGYNPAGSMLCCQNTNPQFPPGSNPSLCTQAYANNGQGSVQCANYGPNYVWNGVSCVPNGNGGGIGGGNPCSMYGPGFMPVQIGNQIVCERMY